MKPQILIDAERAWPEDEAWLTFDTFAGRMSDAQDDRDRRDDSQAFLRDIAHMHKVFSRESDAADLIARYDAELVQHFKVRHKLAFGDLSRYAADDADDLFRLTPFMDSKSIADLITNRDAMQRYIVCTCAIDEMHAELGRMAP